MDKPSSYGSKKSINQKLCTACCLHDAEIILMQMWFVLLCCFIAWLVYLFICWCVDSCMCLIVDVSNCFCVDLLIHWLVCLLICWLVELLIGWFIDLFVWWFINCFITLLLCCFINLFNRWFVDSRDQRIIINWFWSHWWFADRKMSQSIILQQVLWNPVWQALWDPVR